MNDKRTDAVAWRTNVVKGFSRLDGYMNVVNRIGTSKDSSEAYEFAPETQVPDLDLAAHYEGNGLFAKIIDAPAEKAATRDFDLGVSDENVSSLVTDALEDLEWITTAAQAIKWSRLFGGAIIVMLIDDGGRLEEPVNWDAVQGIDELVLFERAVVEPDYYSMYNYGQRYGLDRARTKYGQPECFHVHSQYGSFTVHESRCLVFRNGTLPETTTQAEYRYWGLPEYIRIRRTLRETVTNHSIGTKMLEKSVQGVYKMKDLTEKLAIEGGEDAVYKRMEVIDMVRGFLNSIIIDMDGEDYSFQTFQVSGFKEVIEASCNILSAVSNIPQAILFGSSPTGMDATGTSDLENWYNYLGQISDLQIKPNLQRLLDILFRGWLNTGKLQEEPMYKLDFKPFWNLSESEQADLDLKKIQVQQAKAQVAQTYIDMQALDPQEVRKGLAKSEEFNIEELLDEEDIEDDAMSELEAALADLRPPNGSLEQEADGVDRAGSVGVIVVKGGEVLCGIRYGDTGNGLVCGPGGHVEEGETPRQAAIRETMEEFGIKPKDLIPFGNGPMEPDTGLAPQLFLCTEYDGEPKCIDHEMSLPMFVPMETLLDAIPEGQLFQPFADSLVILKEQLDFDDTDTS